MEALSVLNNVPITLLANPGARPITWGGTASGALARNRRPRPSPARGPVRTVHPLYPHLLTGCAPLRLHQLQAVSKAGQLGLRSSGRSGVRTGRRNRPIGRHSQH